MNVNELSLKERLLLCARVEGLCADRFRRLARLLPEREARLRSDLADMAREEDRHGDEVRAYGEGTPFPSLWHLRESDIERLLHEHFPALMRRLPGEVTRDTALGIVAAVEDESEGFYRRLAEVEADDDAQLFFVGLATAEASHRDALFGSAA
jgi:rubrerythrin